MIKIHELPIDYWIKFLADGTHFSLVGYGDAEWFCILNHRLGQLTGLGQILDKHTGELLLDVIARRCKSPNFLFSTAKCVMSMVDSRGKPFYTNRVTKFTHV